MEGIKSHGRKEGRGRKGKDHMVERVTKREGWKQPVEAEEERKADDEASIMSTLIPYSRPSSSSSSFK